MPSKRLLAVLIAGLCLMSDIWLAVPARAHTDPFAREKKFGWNAGLFMPTGSAADQWGSVWYDLGARYIMAETEKNRHEISIDLMGSFPKSGESPYDAYAYDPSGFLRYVPTSEIDASFSAQIIPIRYTYIARLGNFYLGGGPGIYFTRTAASYTLPDGYYFDYESSDNSRTKSKVGTSFGLHALIGYALSDNINAELKYSMVNADLPVPDPNSDAVESSTLNGGFSLSVTGRF